PVDLWTPPFAHHAKTPTLVTMHGRLDLDHLRHTLPLYPHVPLVSISNHQRVAVESLRLRWAATVYNGLDLAQYHAATRPRGQHLAFIGRINPEKGPAMAVEI